MIDVVQIPALTDNYFYLLRDRSTGSVAAIDPGEVSPILEALEQRAWPLHWIWNTHHHADHTGANLELARLTGCLIAGAAHDAARIPGISRPLYPGEVLPLGSSAATVLDLPGHTLGHIGFYFAEDRSLFCGDTVFSLGCGRLFEGDAETMWQSLSLIAELDPETLLYCAHEYTESNMRFALSLEPDNQDLWRKSQQVISQRARGEPTVPSRLKDELLLNPFLRADTPKMRQVLGGRWLTAPAHEVFAQLRRQKDVF